MDKPTEQPDAHAPQSNAEPQTGSRRKQAYLHRNKQVSIPAGHLAVGLIVNVHGLRGEVRVELHTDFEERFAVGATLYAGDELTPMVIDQSRPHKGMMLIHFRGVKGRDQAEMLRDLWLFVPEDQAFSLDKDTYWVHDIIGLAVQTTAGQTVGHIRDVLVTGANDVYVVATPPSFNQGKDVLLPAIADVILEVKLDEELILVDIPPGLLDE